MKSYQDSYTPIDSSTAPKEFRIWRSGENMTDHGPIYFTEKSAKLLMEAQEKRGNLYSIDYDHLSLEKNRPAEAGKASGWNKVEVREGESGPYEFWSVETEWTKQAKDGIEAKPPEYRFVSPAYVTDDAGVVIDYINLALCINPATHHATSLATRTQYLENKDTKMDIESILAMLTALSQMEGMSDEAKGKIGAIMAELEKAPESEKAEAAPAKDAEPAEEEKSEEVKPEDKPQADAVKKLEARIHEMEMEKLFADNVNKKLTPGQRQWFCSLNKDTAVAFLKSAPALDTSVKVKRADTVGDVKYEALGEGSEDEQHIDRIMGTVRSSGKIGMDTTVDPRGRYVIHTMTPTEIRKKNSK